MAKNWLSLKAAADQLGVHPSTLRRWADDGAISVMLTPGGHRRFAQADIDQFAASEPVQSTVAVQEVVQQQWAQKAIAQSRQGVDSRQKSSWMKAQDSESRIQFRLLGQRLVGLTMQYIAMHDGGEELLDEARDIGRIYAKTSIQTGMPLTETLRASLFFHNTLLETSLQWPESATVSAETNQHLLSRINSLLNTVHLAIAGQYESSS